MIYFVSVGVDGSTTHLKSNIHRSQHSHHDTAFELSHAKIPIKVGSMFRSKSILKKVLFACCEQ